MSRRRPERRPQPRDRGALLVYTAVIIVVGLAALAWAAATFPIDPAISLTAAGGREGILLGLIFWIAIGLLGGTRVERMHGHGALTFHLPFIIAAMAVGGPTAGGLVALLSTIERRELREVPWYGTVFNHAALTLSAVGGGVVLLGIQGTLDAMLPDKPQAVALIAIIGGGAVLTVIAISLAAATVHLRDGLTRPELTRLYDNAYRATAATEVVLGWILAYTYTALGWWAALVAALLVLAVWQSHDATTISHHDPMTGLLNRAGFDVRLTHAIDASQRHDRLGALLAIDLDGFKAINDGNGHSIGDEVLRVVGERLQASIRITDAAVRLGGDEFGVLLVDLPNTATARRLAKRIHDAISKPMDVEGRPLHVGASIGVYLIERTRKQPTTGLVLQLADTLMYEAKVAGGGVRFSDRAGDVLWTVGEELPAAT
jgi:diguanylate cyclase (GGDEF)-like protein